MTRPRIARAREMAGLSLGQAAKLIGDTRFDLYAFEAGAAPGDDRLRRMADVYGVSVAWLRGERVELPASTRDALDKINDYRDRAKLLELLTAVQGRPNR